MHRGQVVVVHFFLFLRTLQFWYCTFFIEGCERVVRSLCQFVWTSNGRGNQLREARFGRPAASAGRQESIFITSMQTFSNRALDFSFISFMCVFFWRVVLGCDFFFFWEKKLEELEFAWFLFSALDNLVIQGGFHHSSSPIESETE